MAYSKQMQREVQAATRKQRKQRHRIQYGEGSRRAGTPAKHAYLRSPMWKAKRDLILARAKGRCEVCRRKLPLEVHHKTYENLFNEPLTDLIALCRDCHKFWHRPSRNTNRHLVIRD